MRCPGGLGFLALGVLEAAAAEEVEAALNQLVGIS
jgi:hypothetical protein